MSENFNALTPEQTESLSILAEECAEVVQAVTKILRHGLLGTMPDNLSCGVYDNMSVLRGELADVVVAAAVVSHVFCLSATEMNHRIDDKLLTLRNWTHHIDWSKIDG